MNEPATPAKLPRLTRWSVLIVALAALVLVGFVVWSGIQAQESRAAAVHRADVLIGRLADQQAAADAKAASDDAERSQLIAMEADLQTKFGQLEASQRDLLRWLHRHGITVPTRLVRVPVIVTHTKVVQSPSRGGGSSEATPSGGGAQRTPHVNAPAPGPTLPNGKPAPGNSGNAPGHNKH